MDYSKTEIDEVLIFHPRIFADERGYFMETFRLSNFQNLGLGYNFVQDNQSFSHKGVLRGIHYQIKQTQGKLVNVTSGSVFDVAVDLRRHSPSFGKWVGQVLTGDNHDQLWLPPGFGHAFLVLSDSVNFQYKTTDYYAPEWERTILWNDPDLNIQWPMLDIPFVVSEKDRNGQPFNKAQVYEGKL